MNSVFVNRIVRACKLESDLYEEVEADKSATLQAALVVVPIPFTQSFNANTRESEVLAVLNK